MRDAYRLSAPSTELRRRAAGTVPSFCRRRPAQASQPAPYSRASEQLKHRKRNPFRQIELSRSTVCLSVCTNGTHHRPSSPSLLSGRSRRRRASSETGPCLNSPSVVLPRTHRTPPFSPSQFLSVHLCEGGRWLSTCHAGHDASLFLYQFVFHASRSHGANVDSATRTMTWGARMPHFTSSTVGAS